MVLAPPKWREGAFRFRKRSNSLMAIESEFVLREGNSDIGFALSEYFEMCVAVGRKMRRCDIIISAERYGLRHVVLSVCQSRHDRVGFKHKERKEK